MPELLGAREIRQKMGRHVEIDVFVVELRGNVNQNGIHSRADSGKPPHEIIIDEHGVQMRDSTGSQPKSPTPPGEPSGAPSLPKPPAKSGSFADDIRREVVEPLRREIAQAKREAAEEARRDAEQARADAEDAKRDAEIAALRKQLEGNPLLREGVDANGILREFVEQGTPEGEIRALRKRLEDQEKAFAARFDELHNATRTRQEEEQRRLESLQASQDENTFHAFATWIGAPENKEAFKHLNAVYSTDEIRQQARMVADFAKRNKKVYTGREVADYLEKQAESEYKNREDRRLAFFGSPSAPAPAGKASIKATPPVPGNGQPRTNKSVQRAMTREEEEAHDLAQLRKATQADAIARGKP